MESTKSSHFKSREEFKRAKDLEEARKAGTAAPEVDEEGNDINPHIPQYISKVPWYFPSDVPTLKHQRKNEYREKKFDSLGKWYPRGEKAGPAASKFRKGACENCGALTHSKKDCLDRPRAKGARWTGTGIAADDIVTDVSLSWEGKRDRWNGYDSRNYVTVKDRYAKIEAERMRLRAEKLDKQHREGKLRDQSDSDASSSDEDADHLAGSSGENKLDTKSSDDVVLRAKDRPGQATARNLRIREDTAKYLRNLDVNSAYYDPKTRSMRADPTPNINSEDKDYAGDNFVRFSGDVKDLARLELHALRAAEQGREMPHLQADPTTAEEVFKEFGSRKKSMEENRRLDILERYGDQTELVQDPDIIRSVVQSEAYVEYNRDGKVVKGEEPVITRTKYPEDIFENNHTSVWGSFFVDGRWGYSCCNLTTRNSYCTAEAGKRAALQVEEEMRFKTEAALKNRKDLKSTGENCDNVDSLSGKKRGQEGNERSSDEGKRKKLWEASCLPLSMPSGLDRAGAIPSTREDNINLRGNEINESELESYHRQKLLASDPMSKYLSESSKHGQRASGRSISDGK